MYFEAFIYDYAASYLGDKYVCDHIDKLDFVSKWIVVPRLTVGKELDKSTEVYAILKKLHRDRNGLVHLKSMALPRDRDIEFWKKQLDLREQEIQSAMRNCKRALDTVIDALFVLDPVTPMVALAAQKTAFLSVD